MRERRQLSAAEQERLYRALLRRSNCEGTFSYENGIRITAVDDGCAEGEMVITSGSMNPLGIVHGGVMCTLMDQVAGVAACSRGSTCRTINCEVRFLSPGIAGKLHACAKAIRMGGSLAVIGVEVCDDHGTLCAEGTYTLRLKPGLPLDD